MQLGFYFDQTRCVGCYTCAVACKDWHDIPAGSANWMHVQCIEEGTFPQVSVAYLIRPCYHCENPACLANCPVAAISKAADTGIVTLDRNVCLGQKKCGICKQICPYGSPQFGATEDARWKSAISVGNIGSKVKSPSVWKHVRCEPWMPARCLNWNNNMDSKGR